jgi:hypothetical protein
MFYILLCFYLWIFGTLNKISISIPKQLPFKVLTTGLLNCGAGKVTGAVKSVWSLASRLIE